MNSQYKLLLTFLIGLYYFIRKVYSISNRNNMNFDATDHLIYNFDTSSSSDSILDYDKKQFVKFKDSVASGAQSLYNMSENEYQTEKNTITKEYGGNEDDNTNNNSDNSGSAGPISLPTAAGGPS